MVVVVVTAASFAGCGGSDFSGENGGAAGQSGDAGLDGGGGQDAAGGTGGSAGAAGSGGQNACSNNELLNQTCDTPLMTTGDQACDACGRTNCCTQIEACLQLDECARLLRCFMDNCLNQPAVGCFSTKCGCAPNGALAFLNVSNCLANNCTCPGGCAPCPMLLP